jgi:hypothetical protein
MPAEMKLPKTLTEQKQSSSKRLSELLQIYSGVSGQIYKSDVEKPHKALYGMCYPTALGFGLLALFKGAWYGYAFFTALMALNALIITTRNGLNKTRRKSQTES